MQQYNECLDELSPWTSLPSHQQRESKQRCALCVHSASTQIPKSLPKEHSGATTVGQPKAASSCPAPTAPRHHGEVPREKRRAALLSPYRSLSACNLSALWSPREASVCTIYYLTPKVPRPSCRHMCCGRSWKSLSSAGGSLSPAFFLHLYIMQSRTKEQ